MIGDGWLRGPQWASPAAQAEWEDRIEAAAKAWDEIEILSVSAGVRPSARLVLTAEELVRATREAWRAGLQVVPLGWDGTLMRVAVCQPSMTSDWLAASAAGDDVRMGELLGYPACCVEFFRSVWVDQDRRDTTPFMGNFEWGGPAGVLFRRLGVRLVPHLPCSFDCVPSIEMASKNAAAARAAGIEDVEQLDRLLSLPVRWTACNGAAVVEASFFRFAYETDASDLISLRTNGIAITPPPPPWRDNDFKSRASMEAAHQILAAAVGDVASAVDLGAGDGSLLARLAHGREGAWLAVESNPARVQRGQQRRPNVEFVKERMETPVALSFAARDHDVAILMPGRLTEMDGDDAHRVRKMLPKLARRLVVYGYADWLNDGGLAGLFMKSGLPGQLGRVIAGPGVEAAEVLCA